MPLVDTEFALPVLGMGSLKGESSEIDTELLLGLGILLSTMKEQNEGSHLVMGTNHSKVPEMLDPTPFLFCWGEKTQSCPKGAHSLVGKKEQ